MCDMQVQLAFWDSPEPETPDETAAATPNLSDYERFIVFFSGGKDSVACVLHLLEEGVRPEQIELHHHAIDGKGPIFMDWPVTEDYCRKFAEAFNLRYLTSWKEGGFEREMLRKEARTAPIVFERLDGSLVKTGGEGGTLGTRLKFPQVTADLRTRWCSAYLKIDVGARIITSEARFQDGKTLVITGERAQESPSRARYKTFERHRCDNRDGARIKRHVDQWRPIHAWKEEAVWEIMMRHRVNPHPAYWLGWGRTSCRTCIFGSANQWSTVREYFPDAFNRVADYEDQFGSTIQRNKSVRQLADHGTPYPCDPKYLAVAADMEYRDSIIIEGEWVHPPGAFGESDGPV